MKRNDYLQLSEETAAAIEQRLGLGVKKVIRRDETRDKAKIHRPCYVRDIEKILHHPYYNRYTDK
ncbi:MAG: phosphohydrolase, partial [Ruminococcaceae bacterium]|nr:phosphohydrolase [Oscillospiraceae bacterium]